MKGSLAILVFSNPVHTQAGRFAVELARAALAKGHKVLLFGLADGVWLAQRPMPSPELNEAVPEVSADLEALMDQYAGQLQLEVCGLSGAQRGLVPERMIPGAQFSSTSHFGFHVRAADRCLVLVP